MAAVTQVPARPAKPRSRAPTKAPPAPAAAAPQASPAAPALKLKGVDPGKDPRFKKAIDRMGQSAKKARSHPPAKKKAAEAQAAALPPANEKLAGAQANKVDDMGAAPTGKPESTSFLAMLRAEIQKVMPKKTKDADDFMEGGDRNQLKGAMTGNVNAQKEESTAGIESASTAPPDTGKVEGKEVTPVPADPAPQAPAIGAAEAMPDRKPDAEVSLEKGKQDTGTLMTDNQLSTGQMEKANDSRFSAVVKTKSEADKFADTGPQKYRTDEQKMLQQSGAAAAGDEKKGLAGFLAQAGKGQKQVKERQLSAKEKDELERKKVADHIQSIFERTKASVDKKLESLDKEVEAMFDEGADAAVAKMKGYVETRFDDRYSGLSGKALWLKDKFIPLPGAVKAWFDEAHVVFLAELDRVVVRVANHVERRLKEAKDGIGKGQQEIRDYVNGLPANLKSVGLAAEKEVKSRFDELRQGVDDKKNDLAQKLGQKYKDATEKGAKALQELKDAHKSLYEKVRDAILAVIKILRDFKNRVLALLAKASKAVDIIVSDPIGFLKNVLAAIKQGLAQFVDNIWTHLKAALMSWLFGSLGDAGIEVPKDFSLPSILKLVLQILGITYERMRAKAVKLIGERNVALIEKAVTFIKVLVTEGPAKLWEMIKEYLSNLKEMIVQGIQEWIITTVIKAAVTKLVSMFNPVGAIIQAILTIYNVVMFLIERINQILAFVEAIVNSVYEIATGQIAAAANWIEKALARTLPLIISFLARLLGITGITEKIVGIIKKVHSKVDAAIDKVIEKVVGGLGKLFGGKGEADNPEKAKKLAVGLAALDQADNAAKKNGKIDREDAEKAAAKVKKEHPVFKSISVIDGGETWDYEYEASSKKQVKGEGKGKGGDGSTEAKAIQIAWFKPAIKDYPPIQLAPKDAVKAERGKGEPLSKAEVAKLKGSFTVRPLATRDLDGYQIGITHSVAKEIKNGLAFQAKTKVKGNYEKDKFNDKVAAWGYNRKDNVKPPTDGDHVLEKQLGGPDDKGNVWPLNSDDNQASGRNVRSEIIRIQKEHGLDSLHNKWLKLKF